jgi:hypothetical protein
VNELKEILAGRNDAAVLLAETAGLMLGFREGTPDEPRARTAACFCLEAGADEDLIQGGSPRESAGPRWLGGHCFGRRAPVRPRGSRVPPDAGHLPEFHVTPFRTILGAIS